MRIKHGIYIYSQAKEEVKARQRAEEREQLEQQKQELQAKFRRIPPKLQTHNTARKDSVERVADLDVSGNLLVSPVRSKKMEADESTVSPRSQRRATV